MSGACLGILVIRCLSINKAPDSLFFYCFKAILVLIVYHFYLIDLFVYKCMSVTLLCTIFYVYIWTCLSEINL